MDIFFCKPSFFSGPFFLYSLLLLPLIVLFLALLLFSQDLEVFDKLCFPPVPAKFLSASSCPLCLPVQDTWHLQHETWMSCLTEHQVCCTLLLWAFTGDLDLSRTSSENCLYRMSCWWDHSVLSSVRICCWASCFPASELVQGGSNSCLT